MLSLPRSIGSSARSANWAHVDHRFDYAVQVIPILLSHPI
jgi:hypothetical protein